MKQEIDFDLKLSKATLQDLVRGDLVFKNGAIWICASKATNTFLNMETREKIQLTDETLPKLNKLQLVPIKWEVADDKVYLQGRELGMGPTHKISISWLRSFQQMEMISKAKEHGRDLKHKVVLCETTKEKTYLIVGIDLL